MDTQIIGISGSPVKNSNTDRIVRHILESSGLKAEFIKLSKLNVRPCRACKQCVEDNICKVKDDFPLLAKKLRPFYDERHWCDNSAFFPLEALWNWIDTLSGKF